MSSVLASDTGGGDRMKVEPKEVFELLFPYLVKYARDNGVPDADVWSMVNGTLASELGSSLPPYYPGWLEIDRDRGVIYFHRPEGTLLRICRLPAPIPKGVTFIDITLYEGKEAEPHVSYTVKEEVTE